jgi:hypothetical protein
MMILIFGDVFCFSLLLGNTLIAKKANIETALWGEAFLPKTPSRHTVNMK